MSSSSSTTTNTTDTQSTAPSTAVAGGESSVPPPVESPSSTTPPAFSTPLAKLPVDADVSQIIGQLTQEQQLRLTMQQQYEEMAKKNALLEQREKERADAEMKAKIADITKLHVEFRKRYEENKKRVPVTGERDQFVLEMLDAVDAELRNPTPNVAKLEELMPQAQMRIACSNDYTEQQHQLNETTAQLAEALSLLKETKTRQHNAEQIQRYNALMTGTANLFTQKPQSQPPQQAPAAPVVNAVLPPTASAAVRCNASFGQPSFSLDTLLANAQRDAATVAAAAAAPPAAATAGDSGPPTMQIQTFRASADYLRDTYALALDEIPDVYTAVKLQKGGIEPTYDECNRYALQNAAFRKQACTMRAKYQPDAKPLAERVNYRGEFQLDTGADEYIEYMVDMASSMAGNVPASSNGGEGSSSSGAAQTERAAQQVPTRVQTNDGKNREKTWMLHYDPALTAFIVNTMNDPRISGPDLFRRSNDALNAIRMKTGKGPRWYDASKVTPTGLSKDPIDPPMTPVF